MRIFTLIWLGQLVSLIDTWIFIFVAALIGYQYPAIRELEDNLPDA